MQLFYSQNIQEDTIILEADEHRHCVKSLRKKIGDILHVIDGSGYIYKSVIIESRRNSTKLRIESKTKKAPSSTIIEIAIAPTKNLDRIEWMVEKSVELGIQAIHFIQTFHSERKNVRLDRLNRIVISAMKQSKNVIAPSLNDVITLEDLLSKDWSDYNKLVGYVPEKDNSITAYKHHSPTLLLIGPEGDFSEDEVAVLIEKQFTPVTIGNSVLRTETAAVAALSALRI